MLSNLVNLAVIKAMRGLALILSLCEDISVVYLLLSYLKR